ncbi:MAG: hypothetical protein JXA99_11640, partial [Candidatus Lokiarchaeota archaeon]|nr:hypothetical protein [Candidatus Lokiarchaeota archaeon]
QITKFKYLNEVFAVYRISSNTISRSKDKIKQLRFNLSMYEMRVYFLNKYNYPISKKIMKRYNDALLDYKLYNKKYKGYFPLLDPSHFQILKEKCLKKSDKYFIYYLEILRKIINKCLKKINENCCFNTRHK